MCWPNQVVQVHQNQALQKCDANKKWTENIKYVSFDEFSLEVVHSLKSEGYIVYLKRKYLHVKNRNCICSSSGRCTYIYRAFFLHWYPTKKLKYGKPRLGESTLT